MNLTRHRHTTFLLVLSGIFIGTAFLAGLNQVVPASEDLTVIDLTWEPEHPVHRGFLIVNVVIENVGQTQSSNKYTMSLYVDGWRIDGWLARLIGFQPAATPRIPPNGREVWHYRISDRTVLKPGNHQLSAAVNEPNDLNPENNELSKTVSISPAEYSSDFNIINYGMCKEIGGDGLPLNITETYSSNDVMAVSYFYADITHADWQAKRGQGTNFTFRVYSPNGTLHVERSNGYSILLARDPDGKEITGFALQLSVNRDFEARGKEGDPRYEPGYQALGKHLGIWKVEIVNKDHPILSDEFIIETRLSQSSSTASSRSESALTSSGALTLSQQQVCVAVVAIMVVCLAVVFAVARKRKKTL